MDGRDDLPEELKPGEEISNSTSNRYSVINVSLHGSEAVGDMKFDGMK